MKAPTTSRLHIEAILPKVEKPARYAGGEWNTVHKDWDTTELRVALAYPDTYEIGSSHLGLQILYELINARADTAAERTFAPWVDMEAALRAAGLPLFSLESRRPVAAFDLVGFTLPYELTFTNVLNMLDLSGLPVLAAERMDGDSLVVAGGSGAFNPEPLADFVDLFVIGDGEEVIHVLLDSLRDSSWRPRHGSPHSRRQREAFLQIAARVPGVYVPRFFRVEEWPDGPATRPAAQDVPRRIRKAFVSTLPFAPVRPVVPFLAAVHDRAVVEIMRGCARGCRFCQAGVIYRSVRERPVAETISLADQVLANTGHVDLGLVSLSSADHSGIEEIVRELGRRHPTVTLSLPSLRVDAFSVGLAAAIQRRKAGFTFAPEAGSQRMRDLVNKHITEDDILGAAEAAFARGWSLVKLYFMIGLPQETIEDVAGIASLVRKVLAIGRRHRGGRAQVNLSVNTFVPKPHTPFQWSPQDDEDSLWSKQSLLKKELLRGLKLSLSDNRVSFLEGALARGDRKIGKVILRAWQLGAKFDAWRDRFRWDYWQEAFAVEGCDPTRYSHRPRCLDEALPWDHIDSGVSKGYLKAEYARGGQGAFTPDCHIHDRCSACGHFALDPRCREAANSAKNADHL